MKRLILAAALVANGMAGDAHDLHNLPLGDNLKSAKPEVGHLWPCRVEADAGGAFKDGPWINTKAGTWDKTAKVEVPGATDWPHSFTITLAGGTRMFTSNGLPDHGTGTYPIPADSEAYGYDRNPNRIKAQKLAFSLPANPKLADKPSCAPGAVGITVSGVALFSAIDAPGRDAPAHEVQDKCDGHPQTSGIYHYHNLSRCIADRRETDGSSTLVGYAIDGFGIYGPYGANGQKRDSKDLDECHGMTSVVMWDGKPVNMYHYVATDDFPYTVGCIKGTPDSHAMQILSGPPPGWFQ